MTTKEVSELTGIAPSTVSKYADILGITYLGSGYRKIYDWKEKDIPRLKSSLGKRGRKKKESAK